MRWRYEGAETLGKRISPGNNTKRDQTKSINQNKSFKRGGEKNEAGLERYSHDAQRLFRRYWRLE